MDERDLDLDLPKALAAGDPAKVTALIEAGADVRYKRDDGYDALIDAVHGRDIGRDPRLLDLLRLLIGRGVDLRRHRLQGVRPPGAVAGRAVRRGPVAARRGGRPRTARMDAAHGGRRARLALRRRGAPRQRRGARGDRLVGEDGLADRPAAGTSRRRSCCSPRGAKPRACACGRPPLFYAIEGHHPEMVRWLLDSGQDVDRRTSSTRRP